MFLTKRRSFVIIEIESMELVNIKKERIEKAIQIINNNQTKVEYALILYYNIFKQFLHYFYNFTYIKICINDICYKKFELKTIDFIHNKHIFSFKKFNGEVGVSEETWLSSDKPKELNSPNIIFGKSLFKICAFLKFL